MVVANLAKRPFIDHFLRLGDGGNAPVVMADHVNDLGLFDRLQHLPALLHIHRQRFFAEDMLARPGGCNRDFSMGVVRRVDVDDINFRIGDHLAPVGRGMIPSMLLPCFLDGGGVAATYRVQPNAMFHVEKTRRLTPAVAVRLAHEKIAD